MSQLSFQWGGSEGTDAGLPSAGQGVRAAAVRVVEYCPFPRSVAGQGWRVGFARAVGAPGVTLEVGSALPVDTLLRLTFPDIGGPSRVDVLARVDGCCPSLAGGFQLRLTLLGRRERDLVRARCHPAALARSA